MPLLVFVCVSMYECVGSIKFINVKNNTSHYAWIWMNGVDI